MLKTVLFLVIVNGYTGIALGSENTGPGLYSEKTCWKSEINPATKSLYTSHEPYQKHLDYWDQLDVPPINSIQLGLAYTIYKTEKKKSLELGNDKVAHCYIGCRIAKKLGVRTTQYVGWYKELKDLTDCSKSTHFEGRDYHATVSGALAPGNSAEECVNYCLNRWEKNPLL